MSPKHRADLLFISAVAVMVSASPGGILGAMRVGVMPTAPARKGRDLLFAQAFEGRTARSLPVFWFNAVRMTLLSHIKQWKTMRRSNSMP